MREIIGKGQGEFEMECIEVTAKTVDDAITEGLIKLGTTSFDESGCWKASK